MVYFIQGLTMGLAYVAPIGMQNLFMINTALTQTKSRTYFTAFVIMFFDITLSLACYFGIGAIMESSQWVEMGVLLVGSLIVIWIGISLLRDKSTMDENSTNVDIPIMKVIVTACVVTWFNPQALIDGTMMLGAFKATIPDGSHLVFILGVAAASCTWWLGLSTILSIFRAKFTNKILRVINIICGLVIIFYGVKLFINFVQLVLPLFT